nr:unnamed protein product [Digitaria exilis]
MKLFMCFGGAAAVVDDEAAAVARHRDQRGCRSRSSSFRGKFLSGKKGSKKSPLHESKMRGMDADDVVYGVFGPSTASSSALSSAASLDSGYSSSTSSSSSSSSARSSTASSSRSVSGELFSPAAAKRRTSNNKQGSSSPAAGAAAVVLCLLMVVFCGPVGATLLMSMALYLFPRRWPARMTPRGVDGVGSPECDAEEATTARTPTRRKVVMDQGFLVRNRKKCQ